jgi:enoyl-CoA hydratase/carnithine racemase
MTDALEERDGRLGGFVDGPALEDYAARYADHFVIQRNEGVVEVRMHTADRAAVFSRGLLNAWGQLLRDVGADRENEVLILTGTGRQWIAGFDPGSFAQAMSTWHSDVLYEHYIDGIKLLERLAFDIDIPTIAAINGPGPRQELALMCDLRLCAEDTVIADGNFVAGSVPGDGMHLVLQELLGPKRAAQMVYTGEQIDAATALRLGLVNEVLPPDQVMTRAREIAAAIMAKPRTARRLTHAVIQRPWQQRIVEDLRGGYAHQLLASSH